jgi:hypothetical protein
MFTQRGIALLQTKIFSVLFHHLSTTKILLPWLESLHKIWHRNMPHNKIADDINQIIMNLKSSYLAAADVWAHMDIR